MGNPDHTNHFKAFDNLIKSRLVSGVHESSFFIASTQMNTSESPPLKRVYWLGNIWITISRSFILQWLSSIVIISVNVLNWWCQEMKLIGDEFSMYIELQVSQLIASYGNMVFFFKLTLFNIISWNHQVQYHEVMTPRDGIDQR